jgi:hypothetical protein
MDAGTKRASRQRGATSNTEQAIQPATVTAKPIQPSSFRCRISARPMLQTPGMYSGGDDIVYLGASPPSHGTLPSWRSETITDCSCRVVDRPEQSTGQGDAAS